MSRRMSSPHPLRPLTMRVCVNAHAKINLSLDVGQKGPSGYHALETVMQTISLADTVSVQKTPEPGILVACTSACTGMPDSDIPTDNRNTAYRAAAAVLERTHARAGVSITIVKRIPVQAGLGGGSSDAAAVLRALALLLDWHPSHHELASTAMSVGSDVPFFLTGGTALVEGIGQTVTPLPAPPPMHLVIAKPTAGVSTEAAYRALDDCPTPRAPSTPGLLRALAKRDRDAVVRSMGNHFEYVVPELVPAVAELMAQMRSHGALSVHLCGSGSAAFALAMSPSNATQIGHALAGSTSFVAITTTVGPASAADLTVIA